jgi:N-acyl-phosphatidylethanolamine-hydrolysing phospholipase D
VVGQRRVTNAGVKLESLPHIDIILISHNHYNHFDLPSIERIAAQQGNTPPQILTGLGNKTLLQKYGPKNVSELGWGDTVEIGGMQFHFLEAIHGSSRGLFDTGKSLWGSFLIQTPEGNIYFAGDTAYGDHFKRVYEKFGPVRLALLPSEPTSQGGLCGESTWIRKRLSVLISTCRAVKASPLASPLSSAYATPRAPR